MRNVITLFTISVALSFCTNNKSSHILASEAFQLDTAQGLCPYLTKDAKGNTVISWVRINENGSSSFCYAVCKDGNTFSAPIVIPNSENIEPHSENLPKIIFKPSGEIIALWGAANPNPQNKYSGLVFYVQSFDDGKTWTSPKPLINNKASFDQRYYDVALLNNGEAGIIWLDNRKTNKEHAGSALYFATTRGKDGFQNDTIIAEPCCPCCRTALFVNKRGDIHVLYRAIINDTIRDMVHAVSTDGGKTFSKPQRISNDNWVINGCPHTGPSLTATNSVLHFAWFTGGKNPGCYYTRSTDNGKTFFHADSICSLGSHPQIAALYNDNIVVAWDETVNDGNKIYKKIGLQQRDVHGKSIEKIFITSQNADASYPVVIASKNNRVIVAYCEKTKGKNYIFYQPVTFQ